MPLNNWIGNVSFFKLQNVANLLLTIPSKLHGIMVLPCAFPMTKMTYPEEVSLLRAVHDITGLCSQPTARCVLIDCDLYRSQEPLSNNRRNPTPPRMILERLWKIASQGAKPDKKTSLEPQGAIFQSRSQILWGGGGSDFSGDQSDC